MLVLRIEYPSGSVASPADQCPPEPKAKEARQMSGSEAAISGLNLSTSKFRMHQIFRIALNAIMRPEPIHLFPGLLRHDPDRTGFPFYLQRLTGCQHLIEQLINIFP
jgi:hypothetical protein